MVTNIALVAHDSRKQELLDWVRYNAGSLKHCHLFCTGTTGRLVSETLTEKLGPEAPSIVCLLSGPLGGDFEIGGMIAEGKIDMLVFFCDNLIMQGHQNDVMGLVRLAARISGDRARYWAVALTLTPLGGAGLFLGLSATTVKLLRPLPGRSKAPPTKV